MKAVIGVDIGTQGTKASLFTQGGECLATSFRPSRLHRPAAGQVEEDPQDQIDAVCATIHQCVSNSGVAKTDVIGVAIAGQMAGVIGIGADGLHVTPYDSWLDTRCAPQIAELSKIIGERILRQAGTAPGFNHGPKILWWKRRTRDYRRIRAFVQPGGYAAMRLCGLDGSAAFIDTTYLHFSGFAKTQTGTWDMKLAERCGIDPQKLPRILRPQAIVGGVSRTMATRCGLAVGTAIAAGCGDTAASFLAAGATHEGVCIDVAGTASVFAATVDRFVPDTAHRMLSVGRSVVPGLWHPYAYVNGGGMNLEWFRANIVGFFGAQSAAISFEALTAAAEALGNDAADSPLFIPHLEGRSSPSQPAMRGAWVGLDRSHNAAHLYRAVLEGVALEYALYQRAIQRMYPDSELKELRVVGGGGSSHLWNRIKSDALQTPLRTVKQAHGAPLGSALLAGWATGLLPDLPASAAKWIKTDAAVRPQRKLASVYQQRIARYESALAALNMPSTTAPEMKVMQRKHP